MKQAYTKPDVMVLFPEQDQDVLTLSTTTYAQDGDSASWNTEILF